MQHKALAFIFIICLFISACSTTTEHKSLPDGKGYFSTQLYIKDYEQHNLGQPYMVTKKVTIDDKTDSTLIAADSIGWPELKKMFAAMDIGYPEYVGKYVFTSSTNESDQIFTFKYEAKERDLQTQKLEVSVDDFNDRVRYMYIDWQESKWYATVTKNVYFAPLKTLKIITETDPLIGKMKKEIVEYIYATQ